MPFPFSDLSAIKQRPVIVLSKENNGADIITCGITSNLKDATHSIMIENNDLATGQIPATSRIKVDKLFTIEKSIVRKKIGRVNALTMQHVRTAFINLV